MCHLTFDQGGDLRPRGGVQGNGQSELVEVVAGLRPFASGSIRVNGTPSKEETHGSAGGLALPTYLKTE